MSKQPSGIYYDPTDEASDPNLVAGRNALGIARKCEERPGGHLVEVTVWPPKTRFSGTRRMPSSPGVCEDCGAHVIVYDPIQPGLRVKLPGGQVLTGEVAPPFHSGKAAEKK
jgi:hypothetical protein